MGIGRDERPVPTSDEMFYQKTGLDVSDSRLRPYNSFEDDHLNDLGPKLCNFSEDDSRDDTSLNKVLTEDEPTEWKVMESER